MLYALLLVEKPQGVPHHFAGVVVATGINLLPDHRFEFWVRDTFIAAPPPEAIAKFDIVPAGGLGPGFAIGRRGSLGIGPEAGRPDPAWISSFERNAAGA